jgi:hypothetical protein
MECEEKTTIGLKDEAIENSVTGWNVRDHCPVASWIKDTEVV